MTTHSTTAEDRLAKLGTYLSAALTPFGAYVPAVQTGNLLFLSGMLATSGHTATVVGVVGKDLDVKAGREAAFRAALSTLINISSVLALAPEWFNGSYSGTKAYLLNLSLRLQQEVAGKGVRVQVVLPGATRTAIWGNAGVDIATVPPSMVMEVDEVVDAALVGLDRGEAVTIPSLPDIANWEAYEAARQNMIPKLSRSSPACVMALPF